MTQKQVCEAVKLKLATSPSWALRGLVRIYEFQTISEQQVGNTTDANGVGFSGVDAEILSSFARQVNMGRTLSVKQMLLLHKKMPRYWKQISGLIATDKLEAMIVAKGA
jgi:hypothetical protein